MVFKNKPKLTSKGIPFNYTNQICKECSKEFNPMSNVQKFCSLTCQNRDRRKRNAIEIRKYNYEYSNKNPIKTLKWKKKYDSKPTTKIKKNEYQKKYSKIPRVKERINTRNRKRRIEDPSFRIQNNIRTRIHKKIKTYKKYGKINASDKSNRLKINPIVEKLMRERPKDYKTRDYHIDHIIPLCAFDLSNETELRKAFHPDNHQWLPAERNLSKIKFDMQLSKKVLK